MEAGELADIFLSFDLYGKREREMAVIPDWAEAVAQAEERKGDYDLVLWAGSLYLMGEVIVNSTGLRDLTSERPRR